MSDMINITTKEKYDNTHQPDFHKLAHAMHDELIDRRRDFHKYPEIAFQEHRTAGIIEYELNRLGMRIQTGVGKTGVVGILEGKKPGKTVLYRADMDALPIQEENDVPYKSRVSGMMHACGHDGHMTIALAVAKIMAEHREQIEGRIKFVFQPGEEGAGGALAMIRDDVLENPEPDISLGLHLWQPIPFGKVGTAQGAIMSGSSTFKIVVRGRGGHAAMPHTTIDPVVCTGQLINSLHTLVSRRMDAMSGAVVLSVTGLHTSSFAHNIIPDTVEIMGTFRTFNAYTSEMLEQQIRNMTRSVCESVGCTADVRVRHLTIPVVNHTDVVTAMTPICERIFGKNNLLESRTMASEDMSYYLDDIPGMFFLVGSSNPKKGLTGGHHHPTFNFDEDVLPVSVELMCSAIAEYVMPVS
ncbi:MAG: M20 metallopeptidase family protein [Aggregatilineales bacterium]